ncbi:hypothetical protein [Clostridium diolis]|uniref:hypothetical protein n=1 Tax=Clostridium diolis TaxID=223919 RepID=UPI003AF705CA
MQDELKIKILKREEHRILIEVKYGSQNYTGYIEFNNKSSERIRGMKSKRKLIYNKLEKRVGRKIAKVTDTEIIQAVEKSLKSSLFNSNINNIELQSTIFKNVIGKTLTTRGVYRSVYRNVNRDNRPTLRLTESESGDTLPPIVP